MSMMTMTTLTLTPSSCSKVFFTFALNVYWAENNILSVFNVTSIRLAKLQIGKSNKLENKVLKTECCKDYSGSADCGRCR